MELGEGTESTPVVEDAQSHETRSGRKRKANSEQPRKTVRPGPSRSNLIAEEKTWLEEYWKKNPVTAEKLSEPEFMQELLTTLAKTAPFSRRGDQAMMSDLAADMVRRSHPEASKGKSRTSRSTGGEPAAKRQRAQTESAGVDAEALRRQTLATELLEKKAEVLAIERDLGTEATALSATSPQCEAAFNRLGEIFAEVSPPQSRCLQSLPFSIGSLCPLCPMKAAWQLRRPDRDFVLNDANALNLQIVALREKLALRCGATLWAADYWKSKSQNPAPDVLSPTPQPHTTAAANLSQRPAAPANRRPRGTPAKTVKGARRSVMRNFSSMEVRMQRIVLNAPLLQERAQPKVQQRAEADADVAGIANRAMRLVTIMQLPAGCIYITKTDTLPDVNEAALREMGFRINAKTKMSMNGAKRTPVVPARAAAAPG